MLAALQSLTGSAVVVALADILLIGLLPLTAFLIARLLGAEARLGQVRAQALDVEAELDRAQAELAHARERLAETRQAAGRAQAEAAERELRLKALLTIDRPVVAESRFDSASRVLAQALKEHRHWSSDEDASAPR